MKLKTLISIIFLAGTFLVPGQSAVCNQTCGTGTVSYPFGFSAACQIQLTCSPDGGHHSILVARFPVESFTYDAILINLQADCHRPLAALRQLFTKNYAPTSLNAILLRDCTDRPTSCFIPTTEVSANFQLLDCRGGKNDNISCYSESVSQPAESFLDYGNLTRSGCRSLFSAISTKSIPERGAPMSLDVKVVRMAWWLLGDCRCSANARCVPVKTWLDGNLPAYRCQCLKGFAGDGFLGGVGCRKESQICNLSKYISGECGGATRIVVLAGGVAVGASLIACFTLALCFIRNQSKLKSRSRKTRKLCDTTGVTIPIYTYKEMEKATDFFSEKRRLGKGGYGTVYLGKMGNEEWVAIKRIRRHGAEAESIRQVINEIKLLSSVNHPNLVRLLGCCIDAEEQILVYEFMPNGTLSEHLQRERGNGIPWQARLTIAAETAQAIAYLHNATHPPIYHRDVKSGNILLDYQYKSKVADFGLSRLGMSELSHVSTAPQGTPGYLDPQYHQHFQLSDKSDVYSFGVVLAEIITGLKAVDFSRGENEVNLAALAADRIGTGRLKEIIDPNILEHDRDRVWTLSTVGRVSELAFRCLAFSRDMRPSMMEVAVELEQIRISKWGADADRSSESTSCSFSSG